jgi:hypothetical protein
LLRLWKVILRRIKESQAPTPIYQESDMIIRTIRDIFNSDIDTIWIDERSAFERAHDFLKIVMPRFANRLKLYDEKVPLFHKYGIEEEIGKIQRPGSSAVRFKRERIPKNMPNRGGPETREPAVRQEITDHGVEATERGEVTRGQAESEHSRKRMVNVWLEGADEPLRKGGTYVVCIDAGAARVTAIGSEELVEPAWFGRDSLGLTIVLSGADIYAEPSIKTAILQRADGMKPIPFSITLLRAGDLNFYVSVFLTRELFLLQKLRIALHNVVDAELVTR